MKIRLSQTTDDDGIDLTAMIDCIFLLVLFFMVTSTFIDAERSLKLTLPRADQANKVAPDQYDTVSITKDGRYFLLLTEGGATDAKPEEIANLSELESRLQQRRNPRRSVAVRGDIACEYRHVVYVKNVLQNLQVENIFFPVEVGRGHSKP